GARRADGKPHVAKNSRSTGRHCLIYRPSSRTGENPLSGMIGGRWKRQHHRSLVRAIVLPDRWQQGLIATCKDSSNEAKAEGGER
ncbi:MAG: hypothetical protein WBQ74_12135, partial [Candidatus Sulfotelmatobacter sp.]